MSEDFKKMFCELAADFDIMASELVKIRDYFIETRGIHQRMYSIERSIQQHSMGVQNVHKLLQEIIDMTKGSLLVANEDSWKLMFAEKEKVLHRLSVLYQNKFDGFDRDIEASRTYIYSAYEKTKKISDKIDSKEQSLKHLIQRGSNLRISLKDLFRTLIKKKEKL